MRTLVLVNNRLGVQVTRWLVEQGDELVGLVLHPLATRTEGDALIEAAGLPPEKIFCASRLREPETLERIRRLRPEIGLSVLFDTILEPELLDCFPRGVLNLHPSLLPWNRGQYPNVWSIIDGTPSGVTLHVIDATIDTGALIAQCEVPAEPIDTGESLYRKLERAAFDLFRETWPMVREGRELRTPQDPAAGTCHRRRDVDRIDRIDLDRPTTARELINLLRARTFPPHSGAWFEVDGRRVDLRLQLDWADEPGGRIVSGPVYVVAGSRPWVRTVFEQSLNALPGRWLFVGNREELTAERLEREAPRMVFFIHWSWIVPETVLDRWECVGLHMTDLPYGRGGSPLQNLIVRGHRETVLSAQRMERELDAGPVYLKRPLSLEGTAEAIYLRMSRLAAEMIGEIVERRPDPEPQQGEVTLFRRRKPSQSEIPALDDLEALHDFIRMLDAEGYPHAYLDHAGYRFEFRRSAVYDGRLMADVSVRRIDS